jgi:hypothetical protein
MRRLSRAHRQAISAAQTLRHAKNRRNKKVTKRNGAAFTQIKRTLDRLERQIRLYV